MAEKDDYLLDLLVDLGFTSADVVAKAREEASAAGVGVVDLLVANKVIRPGDVTQAKAAQFGAEVVHLAGLKIEDDVIAIVPRDIARKYRVIPVFKTEGKVAVAIADPSDLNTIDSLTHLLNSEIELRVASEPDIEAALGKYYGSEKRTMADGAFKDVIQELTLSNVEVKDDTGVEVEADAPLIRLVNQIIVDAFKLRASDIHLEPLEKRFRLRYRIDGMMQEMKSPPKRLQAPVIARLKIQAGMVISEHRVPQDGRIQTKIGNKLIDLRVSCLPTNHGESIVMRILDKEGLKLGLAELGFLSDDQATFERIIALPDGILLVTGPTGSGKTTTLYSCLNFINRPDRKIITVEDPVEYVLSGINQVQVHDAVGFTFADGAARDSAPGAEHRDDRRNSRHRNGVHRHQRVAHRPPGFLHAAHQRRARRGDALGGHRREAIFGRLVHALPDGATARPQNLQKVRRRLTSRRTRKCARSASSAEDVKNANVSERPRLQRTATTPATAGASASLKFSWWTTRRGN